MAKLIWSRAAIADMQRLSRFLHEFNPEAANRAINEIRQSVVRLESFPESGRPVSQVDPRIRDRIIPFGNRGYVVRYLYDSTRVTILLVRHQRELPW